MKAVIFDMDGTVLDTVPDLMSAANFALEANGLPSRTKSEILSFIGNGVMNLLRKCAGAAVCEPVFEKVVADFMRYYTEHCCDATLPYPGIIGLLRNLKMHGIKVGIVSNKFQRGCDLLVAKHFDGLVDYVCGEREGVPRKPAPDMPRIVLDAFGVEPSEAVYVGDSEVDVATANASSISGVFVTWGFRSRDMILEAGGKVLVDSVAELEAKLLT